jgi:hypothetical protein
MYFYPPYESLDAYYAEATFRHLSSVEPGAKFVEEPIRTPAGLKWIVAVSLVVWVLFVAVNLLS